MAAHLAASRELFSLEGCPYEDYSYRSPCSTPRGSSGSRRVLTSTPNARLTNGSNGRRYAGPFKKPVTVDEAPDYFKARGVPLEYPLEYSWSTPGALLEYSWSTPGVASPLVLLRTGPVVVD
jgi:hypothetical protein